MGWAGQSTPTKVISWIFQAKREWPSANSKEIKLKGLTSNTMEVLWMRTKEFLLRPYTPNKNTIIPTTSVRTRALDARRKQNPIISFRNAIFSNLLSEDLPTINPLYPPEKRTHIPYNLARWSRWWYPFLQVGSFLDWPHYSPSVSDGCLKNSPQIFMLTSAIYIYIYMYI